MKIIDKNGNLITVLDLNKAIEQADLFRGFRHEDKNFEIFDEQQNSYWNDIYNKLIELKKQTNGKEIF